MHEDQPFKIRFQCNQTIVLIQAAVRGLQEELGIICTPGDLQGPLTKTHDRKLKVLGKFCDEEFVECYR